MNQKAVYHPRPPGSTRLSEKPGEYPFTRGIHRNMYRGRLWTMRLYAGFGTAGESNRRYLYLLEQGQTGISIAFDLPTQMGLDADDPQAAGEVGKVGVSISSLQDMETLLKDIPLDRVSISMTINSTAAILLCMLLCIARRRNVDWDSLRGTVQNDILKEYIARGTYIYPPGPSLRIIADTLAFCRARVRNWNPISISGYHIREAGSTAVQEVAFTLANGTEYIRCALGAGLKIDEFAGMLTFFFNAHNNFLEEIAKFRAARRLWARIMRERFQAKETRSWTLRFHTQTAGSALTAQQPENNIARVTIQALAAVLGGTQSLHTNSLDEALGLPSEIAAHTALRTQQILACESGVINTADPTGGSYAIEAMTDEIESEAAAYIQKIDEMGGMLRAIETGYVQREIQESAYQYQRRVESGECIIVGVNKFASHEPTPVDVFTIEESVAETQRKALAELKNTRDTRAVTRTLQNLRQAAVGRENVVPCILEAVDSLATVQEISDCLRSVFGEYRDSAVI